MRALMIRCHRHWWQVTAAWLVLLAALFSLGALAGPTYRDRTALPASDSQRAQELLARARGGADGDQETVVVTSAAGPVSSPAVQSEVGAVLRQLAEQAHVSAVGDLDSASVSADGRTALIPVTFDVTANELSNAAAARFVAAVRAQNGAGVTLEVIGAVAMRATPPNLGGAYLGLLAAGVVLLVTFGALFSMLMPLLTAAVSVGTAVGIIELLSHAFDVSQTSPEVAALLGLGVGVDYALFLITRHRQALLAGADVETALGEAAATSGRSVLFAGLTVCIALMGMFVVRLPFLYGIAAGSSIAVLLTMAASLTLLPALLRPVGRRVLSRRERARLSAGTATSVMEGRRWQQWAGAVTGRPVVAAELALAVVVVLALPVFGLRLGIPDAGLDPAGSTTRAAYQSITRSFGAGYTGPLVVVAEGPDAATTLGQVARSVTGRPDVATVTPVRVLQPGAIADLTIYPKASPQSRRTADLVRDVRAQIPAGHAYVGGTTAGNLDFAASISGRLPLFVGVVVAISFLMLMAVFRSLAIPATAAIMNILAAAVAFGVITAVFQWGWGAGLLGLDGGGPVEPYIPVLLFAALFGLSMDYEVFLVGRIQEEWRARGDTRAAVVHGLAGTGRTITAAAGIMVVVFGAFMLGGQRVIQEAGLGLAVAVLVDAVIIRSVLVPAVMMLLGRLNWALPRSLQRALPELRV